VNNRPLFPLTDCDSLRQSRGDVSVKI
jgi:hypothetical protein